MDEDALKDELPLADTGLEGLIPPLALGELAVAQAAEHEDEEWHGGSKRDEDTERDMLEHIAESLHRVECSRRVVGARQDGGRPMSGPSSTPGQQGRPHAHAQPAGPARAALATLPADCPPRPSRLLVTDRRTKTETRRERRTTSR
jgi:hypothetical protein